MRDEWMEKKFARLELLFWFAAAGAVALCVALPVLSGAARTAVVLPAIALIAPFFCYVVFMTIWHWKYRYHGKHSDLWGAVLLIETSGWFKIVYWFRHILPDWRGTGRYGPGSATGKPTD